ncbi:CLC_0170 family protein [Alkalihalobacillus deserti]|uniref:CLC_0170 family protein n=1 Tax=Alkalihalobacillus deserti TaxID=2879466 RepID=UPI001D151F1C|nr:CLC_0170 family protein [Alkalihalobacillus deserti]
MNQDGVINIMVLLFLISGVFALVLDDKIYMRDKLINERKIARLLGWINVSLGLMTYVGSWVYNLYFF